MDTPIFDFVKNYTNKKAVRLHMPGHKGKNFIGVENLDITEIDGADCLANANGIIKKSEENASLLFGFQTLYSTEGSSHVIRAMLYLIVKYATAQGVSPTILAGRNAHKSFVNACALFDVDLSWIYPKNNNYLSCDIDAEQLELTLNKMERKPVAVYVTSPDYLGHIIDVKSISDICKKHNVLLIVDNAHGAYLKFLKESLHPIDLGATMCCDSAHKTLISLTGSAYFHLANDAPKLIKELAREALNLVGSTSPSYLIMQSLDITNKYISSCYKDKLYNVIYHIDQLKKVLLNHGYTLIESEPLKIALQVKNYGYTGTQFNELLKENNIICEFYDPDYVVFMLSAENDESDIMKLKSVLLSIPQNQKLSATPITLSVSLPIMSIRQALFAPSECIDVNSSLGRILSVATVSCPPAIPILMAGEKIDQTAINNFLYYGINTVNVVKE